MSNARIFNQVHAVLSDDRYPFLLNRYDFDIFDLKYRRHHSPAISAIFLYRDFSI